MYRYSIECLVRPDPTSDKYDGYCGHAERQIFNNVTAASLEEACRRTVGQAATQGMLVSRFVAVTGRELA